LGGILVRNVRLSTHWFVHVVGYVRIVDRKVQQGERMKGKTEIFTKAYYIKNQGALSNYDMGWLEALDWVLKE